MTGKQRILTALGHGTPDVVPLWELAFNEASVIGIASHFVEKNKLPPVKHFFDMTEYELFQLFDAFKAMALALDLDGATAVTNAELTRVDDAHIRDAHGTVFHCSDFGEAYPVDGPIGDMSDLKKYKMRRPKQEDFLQVMLMRSQAQDRAVCYMMPGPFFMSWSLRGAMQKLLMDYIADPDLAHGLARMSTDYSLEVVDMVAAAGADFIVIECDLAYKNGTLMSPAQYDDFVGVYYKEIVDHAHSRGLKMVKHSDGVLDSLIPHFIRQGFDGIHPIQPQCMDIAKIKREFGDRLCIMGNIDCAFLLVFDSPEEVRESVRETISTAAPGGGYIISSSNSIHPGCKPENYIALARAAREFGKYPELAGV